jgi:hypothetical protein
LAGRAAVLAHLRDSPAGNKEKVGEGNGADECPTDGYQPHHQLTHVEKEQTGNCVDSMVPW